MPVPTLPDAPLRAPDSEGPVEERIEERLAQLDQRVESGNREGRRAGRAFMIFAVGALILGMVILVAIVAKLGSTSKPATVAKTAPAVSRPAAPAAPVAAARSIAVTLKEFTVAPSAKVGRAGHVSFAVRNTGTVPHELVVIRTDKAAGSLPFKAGRADEAGALGETGDLEPGKAKTFSLQLKAGHYALICNLPAHYKAGQHADFRVVR
jgi:uncharacterized cupredoxin-like copper-binding protein